jgi:LysM repeat protein
MIRRPQRLRLSALMAAAAVTVTFAVPAAAQGVNYPVTPQQRSTAQQVAQAGVALSELAPNAPDQYTVKRGDTLWDISQLFLRSPWRWPELWGMNLDQIRNPHLIYPGQMLFLDKSGGRARLRVGQPVAGDTVRLSPRVRSEPLDAGAITSVPMHLIAPFLNEAVVFNSNELDAAPRIVAAQEGRVLLGRGDTAYVRGEFGGLRDWRVFREATPLKDPITQEVLGYEAQYLGTAEYRRAGETVSNGDGKPQIVPATFAISTIRKEVGVGDRLAPVPPRDFTAYVPHAPAQPVDGRIVSVYGDALIAGQNQIVALNRGAKDGMERGHVLALWQAGASTTDKTDPARPAMRLPDERHGLLFVFRVFDRVSYALILNVQHPVRAGDRFTQP